MIYRLVSVKRRWIKSCKACEVGHPCNSTIWHSWPHLDGTGKFLSYYTWPHPINWPPVYLQSWQVSHLMPCFLYAGRPKELCSSCIMLYMGLNPQPLAQLPVIHSNSILSPPVRKKHWNFLVATDSLLYFSLFTGRVRYPLSKPTACLCSSDCTLLQVIIWWPCRDRNM